jgi:hypothetical protein
MPTNHEEDDTFIAAVDKVDEYLKAQLEVSEVLRKVGISCIPLTRA